MAADVLSKLGSKRALVPAGVFVQALNSPTVKIVEEPPTKPDLVPALGQEVLIADSNWRAPILDFIKQQILLEGQGARATRLLSRKLCRHWNQFFRYSASLGTLSKCISRQDGVRLLSEIHSGICGNHAGASTLVGKAFRSGFYWPMALDDARDIIRRCPGCQFFSKQQHVPAQALRTISPSWPFAYWGLDSVGPLKAAQGGFTHIFVTIDKFTKWIEVKPVSTTSAAKAVKFIEEITHRFGVPNRIITDLGSSFTVFESRISTRIAASMCITPPWLTQDAMARWSTPMA